jgi:DNA-directed RNA polymerase subunit RPC12/RpoP
MVHCPHCGAEIEKTAKFCPNCGNKIESKGKEKIQQSKKSIPTREVGKPSISIWLLVLIGLFVIILIIVVQIVAQRSTPQTFQPTPMPRYQILDYACKWDCGLFRGCDMQFFGYVKNYGDAAGSLYIDLTATSKDNTRTYKGRTDYIYLGPGEIKNFSGTVNNIDSNKEYLCYASPVPA